MVQLQECIQSWYEVQTPLEECLYLELFNKLNKFNNSNTIPAAANKQIMITLSL